MTALREAAEQALEAYSLRDYEFGKYMDALRAALAEPDIGPVDEYRKYRRGDRLICLETGEYCVIHISGTDRQWVKFPDTYIGVYKNEQLAELFELLPKELELEQPAHQEPGRNHSEDDEVFEVIAASKKQPAKQEPVAYWHKRGQEDEQFIHAEAVNGDCPDCEPLYLAPPQRKPLTEEEIDELSRTMVKGDRSVNWLCRAVERAHGIGGQP